MGPEQLLFLLQSRETMERESRYRLMQLHGLTPQQALQEARDDMARRRKQYAGVDSVDQL